MSNSRSKLIFEVGKKQNDILRLKTLVDPGVSRSRIVIEADWAIFGFTRSMVDLK